MKRQATWTQFAVTMAVVWGVSALRAQEMPSDLPPTPEQIQTQIKMVDKLSDAQLGDVMGVAKEKQATQHWTRRQTIDWQNVELQKLVDANAKLPAGALAALPTGKIKGGISGVRFFSATAGVMVTGQGILTADGSLERWKGVAGWDKPYGPASLVGGTERGIFVVTTEMREVVVKEGWDSPAGIGADPTLQRQIRLGRNVMVRNDYVYALWRWTPAEGLKELRKLPEAAEDQRYATQCAFASEKLGAFIDGNALMVTRDGGNTWVENSLTDTWGKNPVVAEKTARMAFCGEDRIIISAGDGIIVLMKIDNEGKVKELWRKNLSGVLVDKYSMLPSVIGEDAASGLAWICSHDINSTVVRVQGFALEDGAEIKAFEPFQQGENLTRIDVSHGRIYTIGTGPKGGGLVRIWDARKDGVARVMEITMENNAQHVTMMLPVPDANDAFMLLYGERMVKWDGKPVVPAFLPTSFTRVAFETAVLDRAQEKWPQGDQPSSKESAALLVAMRDLNPDQRAALTTELTVKGRTMENQRELVLWGTKRAIEMRQASTTAPAAKPLLGTSKTDRTIRESTAASLLYNCLEKRFTVILGGLKGKRCGRS